MSFWDNFLPKKQEKSITLSQDAAIPAHLLYRISGASPVIYIQDSTTDYLRKGFEGNHVIFTISDWISRKMSTVPPVLYQVKDKGAAKAYKFLMKDAQAESLQEALRIKARAFTEVETHDLLNVLQRPNPLMSYDEFIYGYFIYKAFVGNALIYGSKTENGLNKGKFQELYLLPSNYYQAVGGEGLNIIDHYRDMRNCNIQVPTENILQIRNFSANYEVGGSHLSGMSVLKAARGLLTKSNNAIDAETETLQNRGAAKLLFPTLPKELIGAGITLPGAETIDSMNEGLRKRLREAGNRGTVINSLPLGAIDIGMSPVDLQILESRKDDSRYWASLFHVDTRVILNDHESSTKDNMLTARLHSITDGVIPHLSALANGLNSWFVPSYDESLHLDFDYTIFPEIQRQLRELVKDMKEAEAFTINEIRAMFKYGDYDGDNGNKILVSSNKVFLDELGNNLPDTTTQAGY